MFKKLSVVALLICLLVCIFSGCAVSNQEELDIDDSSRFAMSDDINYFEDRFEKIYHKPSDSTSSVDLFVDKETGVMYYRVSGISYCAITPLYNADGSIMRYDLDKKRIISASRGK